MSDTADAARPGGTSPRPWRQAALALAGLGLLFYTSYGFANWLAGTRAHVPSIVFGWERSVPFLAWTIVPYWTTNLFYAGSLFLCRDRAELGVHVRRLLTTQILAVSCFLLFPLRFSWPKPETSGVFGVFFDSLGAFDKPFNQAPSLHVALTVVLGALYLRHLPRWLVAPFLAWSALVIASTMTTFQHHFIDLPTGALAGLIVVWLWPMSGGSRLAGAGLTRSPGRRRLGLIYASAGLLVGALGLTIGGVGLWLLWPAVSLALVAAAYLWLDARGLGKGADGRFDPAAGLLLAPYVAGAWLNSRWWTRRLPKVAEIADGVFIGRYPDARDLTGFATVIDLTAECARPRTEVAWQSFPMLDFTAPDPRTLRQVAEAIEAARARGPVLVCCALGFGRSIAATAAWLVLSGRAATVPAALDRLRRIRPGLRLSGEQDLALREALP